LTVSAFAADTQVASSEQRTVVASAEAKQVKKAPKAAKTQVPVRVWSLEMSCCEPQ
jgi:predicted extracellular nuclease